MYIDILNVMTSFGVIRLEGYKTYSNYISILLHIVIVVIHTYVETCLNMYLQKYSIFILSHLCLFKYTCDKDYCQIYCQN